MKESTASTYGDLIAGVYDSFYRPVHVWERLDILAQLAARGRALELWIGTYALPRAPEWSRFTG